MKIATGIIGIVFSLIMALFAIISPLTSATVTGGIEATCFVFAIFTLIASAFAFGLPIAAFVIMFANWIFGILMVRNFGGSTVIGAMLMFAFIPSLLMLISMSMKPKAKEAAEWRATNSKG